MMTKKRISIVLLLILFISIALPSNFAYAATTIQFNDPNLENLIRDLIGKPTGDIYDTDVTSITHLIVNNVSGVNIVSDITGLEYFTNLEYLDLHYTNVSDLSPIRNLSKLKNLYLFGSLVYDISPMANLKELRWFNAANSLISDFSPLYEIDTLSNLHIWNNFTNFNIPGTREFFNSITYPLTLYPQNRFVYKDNIEDSSTSLNFDINDIFSVDYFDFQIYSTNDGSNYAVQSPVGLYFVSFVSQDPSIVEVLPDKKMLAKKGGSTQVVAYYQGADTDYTKWIFNITVNPEIIKGSIKGTISDQETGDPIQGATLNIEGHSSASSAVGFYSFNDLDLGSYELQANKEGYNTSSQTVVLDVYGKDKTVNIALSPIKGSITVVYKDDSGIELETEVLNNLNLGSHLVSAKSFTGYTLNDSGSKNIELTAAEPDKTIEFNYIKDVIENKPEDQHEHEREDHEEDGPEDGPEDQPQQEPAAESTTEQENIKDSIITGVVKGKVTDVQGNPIPNARIELHSEPRFTYTDRTGYYNFDTVPLGEHTIFIKDDHYEGKIKNVQELKIVLKIDDNKDLVIKKVQDKDNAFTDLLLSIDDRIKEIDFIVVPKIPEDIKELPKTGDSNNLGFSIAVLIALLFSGLLIYDTVLYYMNRNKQRADKV